MMSLLLAIVAADASPRQACPTGSTEFLSAAAARLRRPVRVDERRAMGQTEDQSRRITDLVLAGDKQTTVARLAEFREKGWKIPRVGQVVLIVDPRGCPDFLYRVTAARILPLKAITTRDLATESPSLRDLTAWRSAHLRAWGPAVSNLSSDEIDQLPLVWQRFELLYPPAR